MKYWHHHWHHKRESVVEADELARPRVARHQYSEDRATVHVRERQVDAMRCGIDRHGVRLRCAIPAELHERPVSLLEHRYHSGLGGNIQPFKFWIERQDVRIAPDC